jgi:hypothetical protein
MKIFKRPAVAFLVGAVAAYAASWPDSLLYLLLALVATAGAYAIATFRAPRYEPSGEFPSRNAVLHFAYDALDFSSVVQGITAIALCLVASGRIEYLNSWNRPYSRPPGEAVAGTIILFLMLAGPQIYASLRYRAQIRRAALLASSP